MFAFVSGSSPAKVVRVAAAPFLISAVSLWLGGCASDSNASYAHAPVVAAYAAQAPSVEVEGDGLPTQPPPSLRIRQMPDDPSEPYSRNYGGFNPATVEPAPTQSQKPARVATAAIPADLPPAFRQQLVAAIDKTD